MRAYLLRITVVSLALIFGIGTGLYAEEKVNDWRKTGTLEEKVQNLIDVLDPTGPRMQEIGERYRTLYFAAKMGKWEFAKYQAEEIEEAIGRVGIARAKRKAGAEEFLKATFPMMMEAIGSKDFGTFEKAFMTMKGNCMKCHEDNQVGFVVLEMPKGAISPVLGIK